MSRLMNIVTPLHTRTPRNCLARMNDDKVHCMKIAREYERDYWDGDRRFGYGGYTYDGRWKTAAQTLITAYGLDARCRILDAGCGKAHLALELKRLLPEAEIVGFDISRHALDTAPPEIRGHLLHHRLQDPYPWGDGHFDLVLSLGSLHNLRIFDLEAALGEIERVGKRKYVLVESFRNELELFNLQCWALTCAAFFEPDEWTWLFRRFGYTGDYEFIYFE